MGECHRDPCTCVAVMCNQIIILCMMSVVLIASCQEVLLNLSFFNRYRKNKFNPSTTEFTERKCLFFVTARNRFELHNYILNAMTL